MECKRLDHQEVTGRLRRLNHFVFQPWNRWSSPPTEKHKRGNLVKWFVDETRMQRRFNKFIPER